jgi:hypothetical protein
MLEWRRLYLDVEAVEAEAASEDAKVVSRRFLDISTSLGFGLVVVWKSQPQSFDEPLLLEAAVFESADVWCRVNLKCLENKSIVTTWKIISNIFLKKVVLLKILNRSQKKWEIFFKFCGLLKMS